MRGTGFGIIGDIIVGIAGAFISSLLFPRLGIHLGTGLVSEIIYSAIGAVVLLLIVRQLVTPAALLTRRFWLSKWGLSARAAPFVHWSAISGMRCAAHPHSGRVKLAVA